eukprot:21216-Chlamydomonas_euryale.AAC.31
MLSIRGLLASHPGPQARGHTELQHLRAQQAPITSCIPTSLFFLHTRALSAAGTPSVARRARSCAVPPRTELFSAALFTRHAHVEAPPGGALWRSSHAKATHGLLRGRLLGRPKAGARCRRPECERAAAAPAAALKCKPRLAASKRARGRLCRRRRSAECKRRGARGARLAKGRGCRRRRCRRHPTAGRRRRAEAAGATRRAGGCGRRTKSKAAAAAAAKAAS